MSDRLEDALARALDARVLAADPLPGGCINRSLRVRLADGRTLFVKHRDGVPEGFYRAEADGLAWLAEPGALRLPEVAAVADEEEPPFLALEWIAEGAPAGDHDGRLGRGLAALHRAGAPAFGATRDGWIGTLPQPNGPLPGWPEFYAVRRLEPLTRTAVDAGELPRGTGRRLGRLLERLDDLAGPAEPPARLHGDLWSGNAMADADGRPVLVDPAPYGGHREVDLAMMRLFGGFSPAVFRAYGEEHPLAPGHEDRVPLYQLYPLLVHVVLFGAMYAARVDAALGRYVG